MIRSVAALLAVVSPMHPWGLHLSVQPWHVYTYSVYTYATWVQRPRATHLAALHSVAQSTLHRRSKSQSPQDLHHNAHVGYSGKLGRRTSSHTGLRKWGRVEWTAKR